MLPGLRICVALIAAVALGAAEDEAKPRADAKPEPKPAAYDKATESALRALHLEAVKRGDLWTVIQLEAAARQGDVKLRSVLGGTLVYGDPLLAFPEPIVTWRDRGDDVVVATAARVCRCAPDGRPLELPLALPRQNGRVALTDDGTIVAMVAAAADGKSTSFFAESLDGKALLDRNATTPDAPDGDPVIAFDGSAIAVETERSWKNTSSSRLTVCRAGAGGLIQTEKLSSPLALGPDARWLICEASGRTVLVLDGDREPKPLRSWAAGAGLALVLTSDREALLVGRDGSLTPLEAPMAIGGDPEVRAIGGWVALCSGSGAKTCDRKDALGATVKGGAPQPKLTALWRWRDLVAAPGSAVPAMVVENDLAPALGESAALYLWRDGQLDVLDLAKDQPAVRPLYTAPAAIVGVRSTQFVVQVELEGGGRVIVDQLGRELAVVPGRCEIVHPQWAVVRDDQAAKPIVALRLDADPAERLRVPLDAEADDSDRWDFGYDAVGEQLIGWRSGGEWAPFDPRTGARLPVEGDGRRPSTDIGSERPGRFHAAPNGARLRRKHALRDDVAAQQWEPTDAWRLQRTLLILDRDGELIATGGKKGWRVVGRCRHGDRLAHDQDVPVVVDNEGKPVAMLAPGPVLSEALPARMGTPDDLPAGAWRVDNSELSFFTPKSGPLVWNAERLGFTPRRLRCPDGGGMLIVTDSLVIEVDATAAKLVGKPKG